jgi:hypothetical protein
MWEKLPGRREYEVTDQKGRVNLDGFRRFSAMIKQVETRGFPAGGTRTQTIKWRRLMQDLKDLRKFGRTREDRIKIIRAEIDAMSDRAQAATMFEMPTFFRPAAHKMVMAALPVKTQQ